MTDRQYLLRRCLRLEGQIISLRAQLLAHRPARRLLTAADRAQIRELRAQDLSVVQIARATGWSRGAIYHAIGARLVERAVGE